MKLHTKLAEGAVYGALHDAQMKGLIAPDVHFAIFTPARSQTHPHGYEIQLGTSDQHSLPAGYTDQNGKTQRVRRYRNSNHGEAEWAATWHEWGWLIAEIFAADPGIEVGPGPGPRPPPLGLLQPR